MSNVAKNSNILATRLSVLYNYFDSSTKLFSNLAKFSDTLAKSFFPYFIFESIRKLR